MWMSIKCGHVNTVDIAHYTDILTIDFVVSLSFGVWVSHGQDGGPGTRIYVVKQVAFSNIFSY